VALAGNNTLDTNLARTSRRAGLLIQIKAFKERSHTVPWLSGGNTREKQAVMTEPR